MDTPDLGPVTKLGMGRRQGPVVTPPKAAASLPEFEGGGALAAELGVPGLPVTAPSLPVTGIDAVSAAGNNEAKIVSSGETNSDVDNANAAVGTQPETDEIVGGLTVIEADMEGVANEELEYLMKRCKRQTQTI